MPPNCGVFGICLYFAHLGPRSCGIGFQVPGSNAGQGSQCRPIGLGHHVGPSAIPRRFPVIILDTESHGGSSKKHNYPRPQDYCLYYGAHQRISQPPKGNHLASIPIQQQTSHMSSAATHPHHASEPNGANESSPGFLSQTGKP